MASVLDYLTEGPRIFLNGWKRRFTQKKYKGSAKKICEQIVKECWNGHYFQTSTGNFSQFWTRDFGWCTYSLITLGYTKEVHQTIRYALHRFKKGVTTTITPQGKPFNFPKPAVDSLPWLIHSIKVSKFPYHSYKNFLNKEIKKFYKTFIDPKIGLVTKKHVSSMKDFAKRKSSCYDNCMVALLAKDLAGMKLTNPFTKHDYPTLLKDFFWNGEYFHDDLNWGKYVAGDANVFPYILGIISDKEMMQKSIVQIQKAELDTPFPLKYTAERVGKWIPEEVFLRNYETDAIWMHMGPLFVKLMKEVDKKKYTYYKEHYTTLIERHGNFLEVFDKDGKPFSTPFYYCDSGMLWAANYLTL